uniref:AlNc14C271G9971 protein n=1 Tax=Albugo laibachii Nc14 TaxID=890382 RepID=F0WUF1_9STRA|nr:AlNc14C271G9971 [Albugo laibachii Nc14]|eukprot:CCA25031.1 AlNc14C271G9971 [Albugo laibachii Nc14]
MVTAASSSSHVISSKLGLTRLRCSPQAGPHRDRWTAKCDVEKYQRTRCTPRREASEACLRVPLAVLRDACDHRMFLPLPVVAFLAARSTDLIQTYDCAQSIKSM